MTKHLTALLLALVACSDSAGNGDMTPLDADVPPSDADVTPSDADATPSSRRLVAILGQSNAVGGAKVSDATLMDPAELSEPVPDVKLAQKLNTDNVSFITYPTVDLQPRIEGGTGRFGAELTLGRALNVNLDDIAIVKCADNGTGLNDVWVPHANVDYPIARDFLIEQKTALDGEYLAIVWIQGNKDAKATTEEDADVYAENLTELFDQLKTDLDNPDLLFVLDEYPFGGTYRDTVRAEQLAFLEATPNTKLIEADDLPQRDDDHYSADGLVTLGLRFGDAIISLLPDN